MWLLLIRSNFKETIAPLKLDDGAKCLLFYMDLKNTVNALATTDKEETFQPLIKLLHIRSEEGPKGK